MHGSEWLEVRRLLSAFDPTGREQEMLELTNRMRINPSAHLFDLINSTNPLVSSDADIQSSLNYFGVNGNQLASEWAMLTPVAPLAWNAGLWSAAKAHSQRMIDSDQQSHQLPGEPTVGDRLSAAGYTDWTSVGENIFAFGNSPLQSHAGFAIDWGAGPDGDGMQDPAGHRETIMSAIYREVGIGVLVDRNAATSVGPFIVTEAFATRPTIGGSWLVGVVYDDLNTNGRYNAREGSAGVQVHVKNASTDVTVATLSAGGYQVLLQPGNYTVTFSGGALLAPVTYGVTVGIENAKLDHEIGFYAPTDVAVSPASVMENRPAGTVVGGFTPTDPDPADSFVYTLVAGEGSEGNGSFAISGAKLVTATPLNFEARSAYAVRVRVADSHGLSLEKKLIVQVGNAPEQLNITGTDAADLIILRRVGTQIERQANGSYSYYEAAMVSGIKIDCKAGDDTVTIGDGVGDTTILGGDGDDSLSGGDGNDSITGDAGNDSIVGGFGDDQLLGSSGSDLIFGAVGNDFVRGGPGNDSLYGGKGFDEIRGGDGDDRIEGRGRADSLHGGDGDDTLYGQAGSDRIEGGGGNDWLYADDGPGTIDTVIGGVGIDRYRSDTADILSDVEILLA